ncbi:MAG TPA: ParB/RepB/Spo0J family partition protein [Acidimicrobiales bacterium]|nr:ParB/RepB/Spo0J family partition protein [Acidimicrobiales bacterium]
MARRSGLGKGLGALIPNEVVGDRSSALLDIPVASIRPNPHQPRAHFDEETLASLAASIRELGVLQPILVRQVADNDFELVAGERRWRAARRAGLPTIPAIVRNVTDIASVEQALVENLHRQDLNPLEEAAAYQQLIEDFGLTHEQLSGRVGRSRVTITNTLRLFQLPPAVQKLVADGQLSAGHARALLGTPDRSYQEALARRAVGEQLSVRSVEDSVRDRNELGGATGGVAKRTDAPRPPGILELEEILSARLDTRVRVDLRARRGKVVIEFATLEDLERIYRAMTEPLDGHRVSPQASTHT